MECAARRPGVVLSVRSVSRWAWRIKNKMMKCRRRRCWCWWPRRRRRRRRIQRRRLTTFPVLSLFYTRTRSPTRPPSSTLRTERRHHWYYWLSTRMSGDFIIETTYMFGRLPILTTSGLLLSSSPSQKRCHRCVLSHASSARRSFPFQFLPVPLQSLKRGNWHLEERRFLFSRPHFPCSPDSLSRWTVLFSDRKPMEKHYIELVASKQRETTCNSITFLPNGSIALFNFFCLALNDAGLEMWQVSSTQFSVLATQSVPSTTLPKSLTYRFKLFIH